MFHLYFGDVFFKKLADRNLRSSRLPMVNRKFTEHELSRRVVKYFCIQNEISIRLSRLCNRIGSKSKYDRVYTGTEESQINLRLNFGRTWVEWKKHECGS